MEILCAPLASQERAKERDTTATAAEGLPQKSAGKLKKQKALTRNTLVVDTVLVVPNTVAKAHSRVSLSVSEIVDAAKATQYSQMEKCLIIRKRNTTIRKSLSTRNKNPKSRQQPKGLTSEEIRPSTALDGSTGKWTRNGGKGDVISQMAQLSIDELFLDLTVDINEQRKVLKRTQQDGYDALWG
jgi:hypothetical protein